MATIEERIIRMTQGAVLALLAAGAYYMLSNTSAANKPVFRNFSGQVITSIQCGNSVVFDVPGQTMIWLTRQKNGVQDFNGPYAVPAPPYILNCVDDVGSYVLTAYALNPDNTQGVLLGSTNFTVNASS